MDIEDYKVIAASMAAGLVIGIFIGRLIFKSQRAKMMGQKILPNELERWMLQPKYSDLLMGKKPETKAKELMKVVEKYSAETEKDILELDSEVSDAQADLTKLRKKVENANSDIEKNLIMESQFSLWVSKCIALRTQAQDLNNTMISLGYQKRFLNYVSKGQMKPTIVESMDSQTMIHETKNSTKQTFGMMESVLGSMDDGNSEYYSQVFNLE